MNKVGMCLKCRETSELAYGFCRSCVRKIFLEPHPQPRRLLVPKHVYDELVRLCK